MAEVFAVREAVRDPLADLRPELDYLHGVCAALSLPDPVAVHLEPLNRDWAELAAAAAGWSSTATALEALADDVARVHGEPAASAASRAATRAASALGAAAEVLERTSVDADRLVAGAAELLADVGRSASLVLAQPVPGVDAARRMVVDGDRRARVCAESVAAIVGAMVQQWQQLTAGLLAELQVVQETPAPPAASGPPAPSEQRDVRHVGGVRVAVATSQGAHVEVTPLNAGTAPAPPAAAGPTVAPAAAGPTVPPSTVPIPVAAPAASSPATAAAGAADAVSRDAGSPGGAPGATSPAVTPQPLAEGSRVAANDELVPSRPAAAAAPAGPGADARGTTTAPGGMMGMGGAGAGGGGRGTEPKRKTRYVADPEEVFGTPQKSAPPVIGERSPEAPGPAR